jgi:hypothetical protein
VDVLLYYGNRDSLKLSGCKMFRAAEHYDTIARHVSYIEVGGARDAEI